MPNENDNTQNTVKYSIWETRTDENQPTIKETYAGIKRPVLESESESGLPNNRE